MVIEHFLTLRDARAPCSLVACLRRASDSSPVASAANLSEGFLSGLRRGGTATGAASCALGTRVGLDGQGGVVRTRYRFLANRLQAGINALQILGFFQDLLVLGLAGDDTRQGKNSDCNHNQQTDDHTEGIKEM